MTSEKAILAGGCFWGMEDLIRKQPGILDTSVGYTGGNTVNPTYKDICTGDTGHAEAIEITFDPQKTDYRAILEFFFQIHDPTTLNRQGNDAGSQYRSEIFYCDNSQKEVAEQILKDIEAAGIFDNLIVTKITPAGVFYEAEDNHQDYLQKHPNGYTCHFIRPGWKIPKSGG